MARSVPTRPRTASPRNTQGSNILTDFELNFYRRFRKYYKNRPFHIFPISSFRSRDRPTRGARFLSLDLFTRYCTQRGYCVLSDPRSLMRMHVRAMCTFMPQAALPCPCLRHAWRTFLLSLRYSRGLYARCVRGRFLPGTVAPDPPRRSRGAIWSPQALLPASGPLDPFLPHPTSLRFE